MLSTKMLPAVGVLYPIYLIFIELGLLDTRTGLVLVMMLINLPIIVWMLYTYFREIPGEILEAARMDGASLREEILYVLTIHALFRKVQHEEIIPHVKPVPDMTPEACLDLITRRFSNPAIVDTTRRVTFEGSSRHTGFVLPILRDGLRTGAPVEGLALVEALWARMCDGTREDGSVIEPNDPLWDTLQAAAKAAREHPRVWLEQRRFYGDLVEAPRFAEAFERWLDRIWSDGCEATLQAYAAA